METEELIKLVDGIYKNILEKFNPGARQMINAGKAYLKALHGAAAASRLYVDAITKLARQAQQGTWGGSSDIGSALMKIVEVYKEIQEQQMNILKAFYVDLLVPLETNLEKDTKVVQSEQKKFLQQHKQRSETYSKAAAMMKKQRKKSRGSTKTGLAMDKELKNMQVLEEEKTKLDAFCEQSLKTAMTQERRRYGFVLERQCSLAKHYLSYHSQGVTAYQQNIDEWSEVAKTREFLPETVENMFTSRMRQVSFWPDEDVYSNPRSPNLDDDRLSITSQLRKTKSMDASCLDIRSIGDASSPMLSLSRAKSDFNLTASTHSLVQDSNSPPRRPKSMALPSQPPAWDIQLARALYAYLSSGENQLSFLEGDVIALMGDRNKGWQFGENLRTQCSGWFPLAYTEILDDPTISPSHRVDASGPNSGHSVSTPTAGSLVSPAGPPASGSHPGSEHPTPRMFGDTLHLHRSSANAKQIRRVTGATNYIPPPALPAPVPTPMLPFGKTALTQSQSTTFAAPGYPAVSFPISQYAQTGIKQSASSFNFTSTPASGYSTHPQGIRAERPPPMPPLPLHLQTKVGGKIGVAVGNVSLHSSNDSGFSNDPPPQPEVDYSDDESSLTLSKVPIRKSQRKPTNDNNNNTRTLPLRPSNSHGNLVEPRQSYNKDTLISTNTIEKKGIIKRTKSFWRFGKHNSDHEILEGMSMWKHRDLIDVNEQLIQAVVTNQIESPETIPDNRTGSERSNDSDKTINAKQIEESNEEIYGIAEDLPKRAASFKSNQKLSLPVRKDSETGHDIQFENDFETNNKDQFYDDEGDGLMLRTVNRKDILKQYNTDTITDTESESDVTSDDPYDCIVVDDQTKQKMKRSNGEKYSNSANRKRSNSEKFPNVAEIGKKLEQFSKSSKYSPDAKELSKEQLRNSMNNKMNSRNNEIDSDHQEILTYRNSRSHQNLRSPTPEPRHSFKTFGIEENENLTMESRKVDIQKTPQPEMRRKPRHYSENDREMSPVTRPKETIERRTKEMSSERRPKDIASERRVKDVSPERRFATERRSKDDERRSDLSERRSRISEVTPERRSKDSERRPDLTTERRPKDKSSERRPDLSERRQELSERRPDVSERRQDMSERRPDLSERRPELSERRSDMSVERRTKHLDNSSERRNVDVSPRMKHADVSSRNADMSPVERRRKQNGDTSSERRPKRNGSGRSNGDVQRRNRGHSESEQQYYQETSGEESKYDHEVTNRPFLPRTKLVKSNSIGATMQTVMKFEQEIVEYGDGNIKHKKEEYGAVPNHGNIYGPWYDLWGLDATVQK